MMPVGLVRAACGPLSPALLGYLVHRGLRIASARQGHPPWSRRTGGIAVALARDVLRGRP